METYHFATLPLVLVNVICIYARGTFRTNELCRVKGVGNFLNKYMECALRKSKCLYELQ